MGAVQLLSGQGGFVAGPHLNIYNPPTLSLLHGLGAQRWVMPLEMGRSGLRHMQAQRPAGMETEVFAFGRMPLAFSARLLHRPPIATCPRTIAAFSCIEHPDGLMMRTKEKQEFLVLNGIQSQSALVYNLIGEMDEMSAMGVDVVRLSPQSQHMPQIIAAFDAARGGASQATPTAPSHGSAAAGRRLQRLLVRPARTRLSPGARSMNPVVNHQSGAARPLPAALAALGPSAAGLSRRRFLCVGPR